MPAFYRICSLLLVFATASVFSFACALACEGPKEAKVSHCQSVAGAVEALSGSAVGKQLVSCPMMAALDSRPVIQAPAFSGASLKMLQAERAIAMGSGLLREQQPSAVALFPGRSPPDPGLPLYLRKRVLRL